MVEANVKQVNCHPVADAGQRYQHISGKPQVLYKFHLDFYAMIRITD